MFKTAPEYQLLKRDFYVIFQVLGCEAGYKGVRHDVNLLNLKKNF
jgi:hypothetical protein